MVTCRHTTQKCPHYKAVFHGKYARRRGQVSCIDTSAKRPSRLPWSTQGLELESLHTMINNISAPWGGALAILAVLAACQTQPVSNGANPAAHLALAKVPRRKHLHSMWRSASLRLLCGLQRPGAQAADGAAVAAQPVQAHQRRQPRQWRGAHKLLALLAAAKVQKVPTLTGARYGVYFDNRKCCGGAALGQCCLSVRQSLLVAAVVLLFKGLGVEATCMCSGQVWLLLGSTHTQRLCGP